MTPRLSTGRVYDCLERMSRLALALALGSGLLATGCAHEYAYLPVDAAGGGGPAARYPVPPEAPRGEVYVTSFGFMQMDVAEGQSAEMMHARLVAVNNSPIPWTVDGRAQQLVVGPAQPPLTPAYINMNTDAGVGPVYAVRPGQHEVFDLYYAVPAPLNQPQQLGGFALDWRVDVAGRAVAARTPFQRFEGSPGGYDPYPDYVYRRARVGTGVVVRAVLSLRLPSGHPHVLLPAVAGPGVRDVARHAAGRGLARVAAGLGPRARAAVRWRLARQSALTRRAFRRAARGAERRRARG